MKYLAPFILKPSYVAPIEEIIQREFNDTIYYKLFGVLQEKEFLNSITGLLEAIKTGRIWYEDERFAGRFSARTSVELKSIGATYEIRSKKWFLPIGNVPADILFAQATADRKIEAMRHQIFRELDAITPDEYDFSADIEQSYDHSLNVMEQDFKRAAYQALSITPSLDTQMRSKLAQAYTNNLDLYIKGWMAENIPKLRSEVQQHVLSSGRAEGLHSLLEQNYNVSVNKAKFLARQETSLLMSTYREQRYADIGVYEYRWSGANDERERPDHKLLNGKVFRFDTPPITNRKTGARNNPGEDYGCRCVAMGIAH